MKERFDMAAAYLPQRLREKVLRLPDAYREAAEELRLRNGRGLSVLLPDGELTVENASVGKTELEAALEIATGASMHSARDSIRSGFITVGGGHRIGVCGRMVSSGGEIAGIRDLNSVAVRIAREVPGAADGIMDEIVENGAVRSLLIVSPPGGGKTTLLRDIVRQVSEGGERVSLCDERSEVAAMLGGLPQFDVGRKTDVLEGAGKAVGAMLMLRSMNPQVIAMDEITAPEDIAAIEAASNCGVRLIATAHASGVGELLSRPLYKKVLELGVFGLAAVIERAGGERRYRVERLE